MYMAKLASRNGGEDPSVTYGDLAAVVQRKESMEFLHDILPKKVLFQSQYLKCKLKPTYFYILLAYAISALFDYIYFRLNMGST